MQRPLSEDAIEAKIQEAVRLQAAMPPPRQLGGKRRERHTPEQIALEQAVMRARAERLSLQASLAPKSPPAPNRRASPGGSPLVRGTAPGGSPLLLGSSAPGSTFDDATLRGWLHDLSTETDLSTSPTEAIDDQLDAAALLAASPLGGPLMEAADAAAPPPEPPPPKPAKKGFSALSFLPSLPFFDRT